MCEIEPDILGFERGQKVVSKRHRHHEPMTFCCIRPGSIEGRHQAAIVIRHDGRLSEKLVKDLEPYIEESTDE